MKKSKFKKLFSLIMGFALAFVAVVTFTAHGKNLTAQAEESELTFVKQVETSLNFYDVAGGVKYKELSVGDSISKNTRFYFRFPAGTPNNMAYWYSNDYVIYENNNCLFFGQFETSGNTYNTMAEVATAPKVKKEQITAGEITQLTVYAFDMLVDFGEIKGIGNLGMGEIFVDTGEAFTAPVETTVTAEDLQNEEKYQKVEVGNDIIKQGSRVYLSTIAIFNNAPVWFYSDFYAIYNDDGIQIKKWKNVGTSINDMASIQNALGDEEKIIDNPQNSAVYAFDMLVDFGEIKGICLTTEGYSSLYVEIDDGTTTPDDGTTTPDDGTTTPDDGTTTPDDGTTTPDDGTTEEPKQDAADKFSDWLNSTFGFNTNGNLIGSIALLLAGVLILKAIFGKK